MPRSSQTPAPFRLLDCDNQYPIAKTGVYKAASVGLGRRSGGQQVSRCCDMRRMPGELTILHGVNISAIQKRVKRAKKLSAICLLVLNLLHSRGNVPTPDSNGGKAMNRKPLTATVILWIIVAF